jgi:uncharacterized protein YndB with AHSA1/START domain
MVEDMTDTQQDRQITVQRTIQAPTAAVFDVLSNPQRHQELDGSGFIVDASRTDRIQQVGDVFTVDMRGDHMGGEYQTDNHVTGYSPNQLLAWQTAPAGQEPPGWQWVWELDAEGSDATTVRHTYDWSNVTDEALLEKVGFPLVSQAQLEDTLTRLDQAVTGS